LVCGAVASPAVGATLTTKVDPAGAGTTSAPKSQNVSFDIEAIKPGVDGHATLAATSVEMALPADFVSQVDRFAVCDKAQIAGTTAKPKCPDDTLMGTSVARAWIPSLAIASTTDGGYIYKTGDNTFRVWFHTSKPVYAGIIIDGVFKEGPAPFGPTSVWDFGPTSRGEYGGSEVRIDGLSATWAMSGTVQPTQPGPPLTKPKNKAKQTQKRCRSRARKLKNAKKRRAALRRCAKKVKKKHATRSSARSRAAAASGVSPFASTGCGGGKWGFEARLTYKDGSKETLDSSLDCASGTGGSGGGGGSGLPCVPVPGAPPPAGCGGAFATTSPERAASAVSLARGHP
jgi:hypothetical protein